MCEFISWIEDCKEIYFLTCNDLNTKEGRKLVKELKDNKSFYDDISGHGAIRKYFNLKLNQGKNKECSDFSNPNNFPPQIIKQIKNGNMQIISQGSNIFDSVAKQLLTDPAFDIFLIKCCAFCILYHQAWDEYKKSIDKNFWKIFSKKSNRKECWR